VRQVGKSVISLMVCAAALGLAGCSSGSSSANSSSTGAPSNSASPGSSTGPTTPASTDSAHPHPSTVARIPAPKETVAVAKGYAKGEKYCAVNPATGTLVYSVSGAKATVTLGVGGLPAGTALAILWQTSDGNGRSIGAFETSASGAAEQSTLHMFAAPNTRGAQVVLTRADGTQVAELNRC
jgi:hypothetical protein